MLLAVDSFAHFLVDALCAAALFGPLREQSFTLILLYNTLAFSTQCLVGLAADRLRRHLLSAPAAILLVVLGWLLPLPAVLRVCMIGLGNSVFHVAAGALTLERSGGRAGPLGVFVAPGAIGVTLGSLRPSLGPVFALLSIPVMAAIPLAAGKTHSAGPIPDASPADRPGTELLLPLLLTAAVAVRAIGGAVVSFPWQNGAVLVLVTTLCVFAGKTAGGFLCDRLGPGKAALVSIPPAALLITFCSQWMLPSLAGQFALNLTMPITLWLLYRAMPRSPGFAFGLAASALWPGMIAGKLIVLTGPAQWALTLVSFAFGLWAIYYALGHLPKNNIGGTEL